MGATLFLLKDKPFCFQQFCFFFFPIDLQQKLLDSGTWSKYLFKVGLCEICKIILKEMQVSFLLPYVRLELWIQNAAYVTLQRNSGGLVIFLLVLGIKLDMVSCQLVLLKRFSFFIRIGCLAGWQYISRNDCNIKMKGIHQILTSKKKKKNASLYFEFPA